MPDLLRSALETALGCQYDVLRQLGRGGMGTVYLARERSLERLVAIKVLPPEVIATPESRERFRREARTAAKLAHPNILPLYTFGELGGLEYYVMGYVRGESLAERLRVDGALPCDEVRRILADLADALDYAHRHGVIHRDIKPANILVEDESGRAMLADFGIAKTLASGTSLTATGAVIGTPEYMSPEQAMGVRELDGRSDIYSLGVLAYRMLTGREPFTGGSFQEIAYKQATQEPPPLHALAPDVPNDMAAAVTRCLAKDVNDRWPDARSLKEALGHEEGGEASAAPAELRDLPSFGTFTLVWTLAWGLIALTAASSAGERVLFALLALLPPIGFLMHVWSIRRTGSRAAQVLRVSFWPPKWWGIWWPRALRRPGDVWDRLPGIGRQIRVVLTCLFLSIPVMIFVGRIGSSAGRMSATLIGGVLLIALLGSAAAAVRWGRRHALSAADTVRALSGPTAASSFWEAPHIARLLQPPPPLTTRSKAQQPETPRDYVRAIAGLAQSLVGSAREVGSAAAAAARQILGTVETLDAEIAALARDAEPSEIGRLEQRLADVGSAAHLQIDEQREMQELLLSQLELARRINARAELATSRRARLLGVLKNLWMQLLELREAGEGNAAASRAIEARVRALCAAADEVTSESKAGATALPRDVEGDVDVADGR